MAKKKKILITAGPTQEAIDPVRFLSNYSSGKMGYALAKECTKAGHSVILVSGPTALSVPKNCRVIEVQTAKQMYTEVLKHFPTSDIVFKVAAVADYHIKNSFRKKIKKSEDTLLLKLVKNPDILHKLGTLKKPHQILVGFAAETHEGVSYARKKLKEKNLDWIALNEISGKNVGFGSDENEVTLIAHDGKKIRIPKQSKEKVAQFILKTVLKVSLDEESRFNFKRFKAISFLKLFRKA
ncbi:MAG: bifunctional phosphopantothenoylcysteine decarboxylase/phosphopantothenate--cysteine ligase CoaBC [bacterium]|nr:bifunctional phosphopantothenoylcysteine decarboxylase/phosphopantothenate--cysteine ligase CoaBC [bacterium]